MNLRAWKRWVVLMSLAWSAGPAPAAETWTELKPADARFSVTVPGLAAETQKDIPSEAGPLKTRRWIVELDEGASSFLVMCTDYPAEFAAKQNTAELLDRLKAGQLGRDKKLRGEKQITVGQYPGRELTVDGGGYVFMMRYVWVQPRLYQLIVALEPPKEAERTKDVERFFSSFQLSK